MSSHMYNILYILACNSMFHPYSYAKMKVNHLSILRFNPFKKQGKCRSSVWYVKLWNWKRSQLYLNKLLLSAAGWVVAFFLDVLSNCFNDQGLEFEANFHSTSNICCGKFLWALSKKDPSWIDDTVLEFRVLSCEKGLGIQGSNVKLYHSCFYVLHL